MNVVLSLSSSNDGRILSSPDTRGPEACILEQGACMAFHECTPSFTLEVTAALPPHPREVSVADILFTRRAPLLVKVIEQFL